ncbi:hypothetical protein [Rhizocola hellebori]|uniref:hypothetical protein n=1 Tax=Rhizocola hellebori TaxID=1392758 RepID=UPI0019443775|nr:hypothetical protein [Rhizocola hellebori]
MKTPNIVDLVESAIGPLSPETIVASEMLPSEKFVQLKHDYELFAGTFRVPLRQGGELRPLVSPAYVGRETSGFALYTDRDLDEMSNVEQAVDRIHLHLLYSHSVAIPDPLRYLTDRFPNSPGRDVNAITRQRFQHYLIFLAYLRPLIDSGAVVLLEDDLITSRGDAARLASLMDDVARDGDLQDFAADRRHLYGQDAKEFARQLATEMRPALDMLVMDATDSIMASMELSAKHGHHFDLFLPYRFHLQVLKHITSLGLNSFAGWRSYLSWDQFWTASMPRTRLDESLLVTELAALDIPDFKLTAKEILAVRAGDEFQEWRQNLRRALLDVQNARSQDLLESGSAHQIVSEQLAAGRRRLEEQIARSSFLSRVQTGAKSFAIGSLVALGLSPFTPPGQNVAEAALGGIVAAAWDQLSSRAKPEDLALLQHYVQLTSPR